MKDVLESIANIIRPDNTIYPLAAIWLEKGLITPSGRKIRISEGLEVTVDNDGNLIDNAESFNAVVTSTHGTINSQNLSVVVMMVKDKSLKQIYL